MHSNLHKTYTICSCRLLFSVHVCVNKIGKYQSPHYSLYIFIVLLLGLQNFQQYPSSRSHSGVHSDVVKTTSPNKTNNVAFFILKRIHTYAPICSNKKKQQFQNDFFVKLSIQTIFLLQKAILCVYSVLFAVR